MIIVSDLKFKNSGVTVSDLTLINHPYSLVVTNVFNWLRCLVLDIFIFSYVIQDLP